MFVLDVFEKLYKNPLKTFNFHECFGKILKIDLSFVKEVLKYLTCLICTYTYRLHTCTPTLILILAYTFGKTWENSFILSKTTLSFIKWFGNMILKAKHGLKDGF